MKQIFDFKSIKTKLFLYFIGTAFVLMAFTWGLLLLFLKPNYQKAKKAGLIELSSAISAEYGNINFNGITDKLVFANNAEAVVFDLKEQRYTYSTASLLTSRYIEQIPNIIESTLKSKNGGQFVELTFTDIGAVMYFFGNIIGEGDAVLVLATKIDPFDTTTMILANQLIFITVIVLLIAMLLSVLLAQKLSKPIGYIARSAKDIFNSGYQPLESQNSFTEIKQLTDALNEAGQEIALVQKLRRELIANTSHDLRTPLTMIKAYAEMVRDLSGDDPQKRTEHLEVIISEADRLSRLVGNLLELSKLETGVQQLEYSYINLGNCIKDTLSRFSSYKETEGYNFELDITEEFTVKADKYRLMQVLYNLISNAVEHAGEDKTVIIKLYNVAESFCRVDIIDHGSGIPKDELPYIWDRYYRTSESHKRAKLGTGLGLSIVKNILTAHGLEFGVASTVGKGTTFYFTIKIEKEYIE